MIKEYKTISRIAGPLVFVKKTHPVGYGELVTIKLSDGTTIYEIEHKVRGTKFQFASKSLVWPTGYGVI